MIHLLQQVLVQEDMFLKPQLFHQNIKIFQDGHYQKQEERQKKEEDQIETKLMILDLLLVLKLIQKIQQDQNAILDQAIDYKEIKLVHSKIKCKVASVLSSIMLSGEIYKNLNDNETFNKYFNILKFKNITIYLFINLIYYSV